MTVAAIKPTLTILVAISALQPIALNLLAPATPALTRHFASNYATIQLTLTLFLVSVALTQLIIGPLSDRFGRRPCVNAGIALFLAGSVLGALAPTTHILLAAPACWRGRRRGRRLRAVAGDHPGHRQSRRGGEPDRQRDDGDGGGADAGALARRPDRGPRWAGARSSGS